MQVNTLPLIPQSEEEASGPSEDELEIKHDVVSITHRIIVHVYNSITSLDKIANRHPKRAEWQV